MTRGDRGRGGRPCLCRRDGDGKKPWPAETGEMASEYLWPSITTPLLTMDSLISNRSLCLSKIKVSYTLKATTYSSEP